MKAFSILVSRHVVAIKFLIHLCALLPLVWLFWRAIGGALGADPVAAIIHFTGKGVINLLLLTLMVSPLARWFSLSGLVRFRRLLGLYAFFYGCSHLLSYVVFDLQLQWHLVVSEIVERPYLTFGAFAFLVLLVLALTSPNFMLRRLGRNWKRLHRLVYLALLVGWIHFFWSVKSVQVEPLVYGVLVFTVLSFRWAYWCELFGRLRPEASK